MTIPLVAGLGTPELLIILAVVVLLFGASKLPDLARNSGRALRIFKAETKGLMSDDAKTPEQLEVERRDESGHPDKTD
jgi:sec-independent protein translocase protein TatA